MYDQGSNLNCVVYKNYGEDDTELPIKLRVQPKLKFVNILKVVEKFNLQDKGII